ncbi:Dbl homology domain-containing protein [Linderina pennispora]|uniref:Dbl homology domain-containing protein n=1 Tax=Linderina pennispora TaxID=61395 RepID=A0A1Y1VYD3_9FUNG|nr:Dbl homology domain-containing protein [Linderina pennispora]ORX66267.1 Dbl homology domain-containing protein [Linderina pennispora]
MAALAATTTAGDDQAKENGSQPRPSKEQESDTTSPMIQPVMIAKPVARKTPAAMRMHSARELVITEKNFVDHLFVIKKPIIPYQTARMVFDGIASLHSHASQFYREMDAALSSFEHHARAHASTTGKDFDDGMRMGRLFRSSERHWSDFITYVRNYGKAVRCLNQLQDYKPFARYHEECMLHKRTNRQSLKGPPDAAGAARNANILKHTPVTHGDHVELCRAVKNASRLASIVNECRRKQEESERVMELFQAIALCPPMPYADSRAFCDRIHCSRADFAAADSADSAPAQAKIDVVTASANETAEAHIEWTYYGSALLDQVEDGMSMLSESTLRDAFSSKKKPKKKGKIRKGILQSSGSGDAIPDHIAALSHSTFPKPSAVDDVL